MGDTNSESILNSLQRGYAAVYNAVEKLREEQGRQKQAIEALQQGLMTTNARLTRVEQRLSQRIDEATSHMMDYEEQLHTWTQQIETSIGKWAQQIQGTGQPASREGADVAGQLASRVDEIGTRICQLEAASRKAETSILALYGGWPSDLEDEIAVLQRQMSELLASAGALEGGVEVLRNALHVLETDTDMHRVDISDLRAEMDSQKEQMSQLSSAVRAQQVATGKLRTHLDMLQGGLETMP